MAVSADAARPPAASPVSVPVAASATTTEPASMSSGGATSEANSIMAEAERIFARGERASVAAQAAAQETTQQQKTQQQTTQQQTMQATEASPVECRCGRRELLVSFLGTGCAVPSKYRAPASIHLHCFERGGVLIDAGEGCLGQLVRLFGASRSEEMIISLKLVWISHMHADHHLGVLRLLSARNALRAQHRSAQVAPPLLVVAPAALGRWLAAYNALLAAESRLVYRFVSCQHFNAPRSVERHWLLHGSGLSLKSLRSVPVVHCSDAWGLVIDRQVLIPIFTPMSHPLSKKTPGRSSRFSPAAAVAGGLFTLETRGRAKRSSRQDVTQPCSSTRPPSEMTAPVTRRGNVTAREPRHSALRRRCVPIVPC